MPAAVPQSCIGAQAHRSCAGAHGHPPPGRGSPGATPGPAAWPPGPSSPDESTGHCSSRGLTPWAAALMKEGDRLLSGRRQAAARLPMRLFICSQLHSPRIRGNPSCPGSQVWPCSRPAVGRGISWPGQRLQTLASDLLRPLPRQPVCCPRRLVRLPPGRDCRGPNPGSSFPARGTGRLRPLTSGAQSADQGPSQTRD